MGRESFGRKSDRDTFHLAKHEEGETASGLFQATFKFGTIHLRVLVSRLGYLIDPNPSRANVTWAAPATPPWCPTREQIHLLESRVEATLGLLTF